MAVSADAAVAVPRVGMWLKGDLHVHSSHSTDASDSLVADIVHKAEALHLDYLAITDHDNHVEGKIETWSDPAYASQQVALLHGVEWTTGKGHANIFSTAPLDYAPIWSLRDADALLTLDEVHRQGAHFSINHPAAKDLWEHGFALPFDSMEVWTAVFLVPDSNPQAIEKWDGLLQSGRRITARGGSDSHHQKDAESLLFNIGNPTTWVHASEKTASAVLAGLAAGHVSVSYAADAERVDLRADADGDGLYESIAGDNLADRAGKALPLRVDIDPFRAGASYEVVVFKNGSELVRFAATTPRIDFADTPAAGARAYYRVEVRGDTPSAPLVSSLAFGRFVALTNPIYVGFP